MRFIWLIILLIANNAVADCYFNQKQFPEDYIALYKKSVDQYRDSLKLCLRDSEFSAKLDNYVVTALKKIDSVRGIDEEVKQNFALIKTSLLLLAESGNPSAQHNYAAIYNAKAGSTLSRLNSSDLYTFSYWTRKAASNREPRSLYNLAMRMRETIYLPFIDQDFTMADKIIRTLIAQYDELDGVLSISKQRLANQVFVKCEPENEKYKTECEKLKNKTLISSDYAKLAPNQEFKRPLVFVGGIGDTPGLTNVKMVLYPNGARVKGYYLYDHAYVKWKATLRIEGLFDDGRVNLDVYDQAGKAIEKFTGSYKKSASSTYIMELKWLADKREAKAFFYSHTLLDFNLTCDEMETFGALAFNLTRGDLGSGRGSSKKVDYQCPSAIYNALDFTELKKIADDIRGEGRSICSGSIRYVYRRAFYYGLLQLSFYNFHDGNFREYLQTWRDPTVAEENLQRWSSKGIYSKRKYDSLSEELIRLRPEVEQYVTQRYSLDARNSKLLTNFILGEYLIWAAGNDLHTKDHFFYKDKTFQEVINHLKNNPEQSFSILSQALLHKADIDQLTAILAFEKSLNDHPESPLSLAVEDLEVINFLLEAGADVNHQNIFGKTPLFYAIQFNQHDVVRRLIELGADVNHRYKSKKEFGYHCEYNLVHTLRTPLMHAAQHADLAMVKLLLENGAKHSLKDEAGYSALQYAKKAENTEVFKHLFELLPYRK